MKEIKLTQGKVALVDDEDFEEISKYKWYLLKHHGNIYANTNGYKCERITMHKVVMRTPKNFTTDHIDGNGLNNQRSNLRICTNAENHRNCKITTRNKTGFKGVSYHRAAKKYESSLNHNKKKYYFGLFKTPIEAAIVYNQNAIKYHGEFARLNTILEVF